MEGTPATAPSNGAAGPVQPTAEPVTNSEPSAGESAVVNADGSSPARGPDGKFLPRKSDGSAPREFAEAMDTAEAAQKAEQRFKAKLKVFGEEQEVDLGHEDVVRELQIARAARRKMEELSRKEREFDERMQRAKSDPNALAELIRSVGADPERFATDTLNAKARLAQLTPEQRELLTERQQREQLQQQLEQLKQQQHQEKVRALVDREWQQLQPKIDAAVRAKGLPYTRPVMAMVGEVGREFIEAGLDLDPVNIAAEVHDRLHERTTGTIKSLPAETLMKLLGDEKVGEILKTAVAKWRQSQQAAAANPPRVETEEPPRKREDGTLYPLDEREWDRVMRGK